MITQQQIDDQQLGERYLADQLPERVRAEFEDYYTEDPQAFQDLQAAASIKVGLAMLRASGELERLTQPPRARWQARLALAAAVMGAVVGLDYLLPQLRGPTTFSTVIAATAYELTDSKGTELPVRAVYDVQRTRSDADVLVAKLTMEGAIQLRLRDALEPAPARYRLELLTITPSEKRQPYASLGTVATDGDGLLSVYLNPGALALGSYELRVFEAHNGTYVRDFLIDIVPAETAASLPGR